MPPSLSFLSAHLLQLTHIPVFLCHCLSPDELRLSCPLEQQRGQRKENLQGQPKLYCLSGAQAWQSDSHHAHLPVTQLHIEHFASSVHHHRTRRQTFTSWHLNSPVLGLRGNTMFPFWLISSYSTQERFYAAANARQQEPLQFCVFRSVFFQPLSPCKLNSLMLHSRFKILKMNWQNITGVHNIGSQATKNYGT